MTVFVRHWWVRFANVMNYQTREATTPFCFAKFPLLEEKEGKMGAIFLSSLLYSFIFRFSSISIFNSQPLHCLSILLLELFVHSFVTSQFFILNSPFSILNSHIVNSSILHCQFSTLNSPFSILNSPLFVNSPARAICAFFCHFSILHSQLSILNSELTHCQFLHSPLSILHSQFSILHSHIVHCPLSIVNSSILHCQLSIVNSPFFILHSPLSILHSPFSLIPRVLRKHRPVINYLYLALRYGKNSHVCLHS